MYSSGSFYDFLSRMHGGAYTTGDLASFVTEGNIYINSGTGVVSPQLSGKWEREARLRIYSLTASTGLLVTQQFNAVIIPVTPAAPTISYGSAGQFSPISVIPAQVESPPGTWRLMQGTGANGFNATLKFTTGTNAPDPAFPLVDIANGVFVYVIESGNGVTYTGLSPNSNVVNLGS